MTSEDARQIIESLGQANNWLKMINFGVWIIAGYLMVTAFTKEK